MKKLGKVLVLLFFISIFPLVSATNGIAGLLLLSSGERELAQHDAIGLSLSYGKPKDLENGFGFGVNFTHFLSNMLSVELSAERYTFDDKEDAITFGEVKATPLLVTVQFRPATTLPVYFGAGIGYYLFSYDESSAADTLCLAVLGETCTYDIDNAFGFHVSAGVDFPVAENVSLTADFRYAIGNADDTINLFPSGTSISGEVDFDYYKIGVGAKYWF